MTDVPRALDGRPLVPFVSAAPNFATTVTALPYEMETVSRYELETLDAADRYRCWSWPDQSFSLFVRDDGQVTITGSFVGDLAALDRLIGVFGEAAALHVAASDDEDGARWPSL